MQNNKPLYLAFIAVFLILFPLARFCGWLDMNTMTLWGRYFCFAIAAIGVDLIWGYTGIMTMCHAFFFCLGAYAMGMFMTLANLPAGQVVPDFMTWNQVETLPFSGFRSKPFRVLLFLGFW